MKYIIKKQISNGIAEVIRTVSSRESALTFLSTFHTLGRANGAPVKFCGIGDKIILTIGGKEYVAEPVREQVA
jgi:hypothetical protein